MPVNNFDNRQMNFQPQQQYEPPKKSNKGLIAILIVLSVVVMLALGLILYMFFNNYMGFNLFGRREIPTEPTTEQITTTAVPTTEEPTTEADLEVPNVVGLSSSDAYDKLNHYGVKYTISREYSDDVAVDHVISQSPTGGTIKRSEKVTIYISKGVDNPPTTTPSSTSSSSEKKNENSSSTQKSGDYILSGSDSRYISASEVRVLSKDEMTLALNEIYARHGRMFVTPEIQAYFNSKSWYRGTIPAASFNEGVLSTIERSNVNTIVSVMQEFGYR